MKRDTRKVKFCNKGNFGEVTIPTKLGYITVKSISPGSVSGPGRNRPLKMAFAQVMQLMKNPFISALVPLPAKLALTAIDKVNTMKQQSRQGNVVAQERLAQAQAAQSQKVQSVMRASNMMTKRPGIDPRLISMQPGMVPQQGLSPLQIMQMRSQSMKPAPGIDPRLISMQPRQGMSPLQMMQMRGSAMMPANTSDNFLFGV